MKAICLQEPKVWEKIDIEPPAAPGPGQVTVKTHRMGICGTDLSGYLGKMPFFSYPRIPGHELGVEVLEVGPDVTNVKPGDRCSVEPYMNCGTCLACRRGMTNCCTNLKVLGVMTDGGLCEKFTLPAHKLHPSASLEYEQLALVETLGIGCHAVDRGQVRPDDSILVIGAGPIGLAAIVFAKLTGQPTFVLDLNQQRLDFCTEKMGVDATVLSSDRDSNIAALRDLTNGELPTIVIDATGSHHSMSDAFHYVGPTGKLIYVGITMQPVSFEHKIMHRPEMDVLASRNALPRDFTRIINLMESGDIDTSPWITHRTTFDEMPDVFDSYTKPETGVIKAVVELT